VGHRVAPLVLISMALSHARDINELEKRLNELELCKTRERFAKSTLLRSFAAFCQVAFVNQDDIQSKTFLKFTDIVRRGNYHRACCPYLDTCPKHTLCTNSPDENFTLLLSFFYVLEHMRSNLC